MLKQRIVALLCVQNGIVVQSIGFRKYLPVGRPEIAAQALTEWGIDEIVLIDIGASKEQRVIDIDLVERVADACSVPLAAGGGLKRLQDVEKMFSCGADKVVLNSALRRGDEFIQAASDRYGSQSVVASLDFLEVDDELRLFDYQSAIPTKTKLEDAIARSVSLGCGEIFINDVARDGVKRGLNLHAIESINWEEVKTPTIWCGGAGSPQHLLEGLSQAPLSGVAASNFWHYSEHSVSIAKALIMGSVALRAESAINYASHKFNPDGRLEKLSDDVLQEMLFEKFIPEVI